MKKPILTYLILIIAFVSNAQNVSEIKDISESINGRMTNGFEPDIAQYKKLKDILKLDVFSYYDLENKYDSELKQKVYKSSEEYKIQAEKLSKNRKTLLSTRYYLDFQPSYYERNNKIKYDLNSKTFKVTNELSIHNLIEKENYIQFGKYIFKPLNGLTINKRKYEAGGSLYVDEYINFRIENETTALKIEENRSDVKLLFVFQFKDVIPFQSPVFKSTKYALLANLIEVVAYNSVSNEVYHVYK